MNAYLFTADWCGVCPQQKDIVSEVEDEIDVSFQHIDAGADPVPREVNKYSVRSLPTIVLESKDSGTVRRKTFNGLTPKDELVDGIETLK